MLELRNVSYTYGSHKVLKNCTFHLEKGDFLVLSGPSGAGKTTLLRLLHGALPLQNGQARVAGFDLARLGSGSIPKLRREVSVVFQDFRILPKRTTFANIALPLAVRGTKNDIIAHRVTAVAKALGLDQKLNMLACELSGGEQQRVALARAVVINPQVLLADEPTGNLDPELSLHLMDILMQFNGYGTTVILASHDPVLIRRNPKARIIRLDEGAISYANWTGAELGTSVHDGML
ncbi:MAG: cell division ATP-binding protein FtsE [Pseudomonadota bacterium]